MDPDWLAGVPGFEPGNGGIKIHHVAFPSMFIPKNQRNSTRSNQIGWMLIQNAPPLRKPCGAPFIREREKSSDRQLARRPTRPRQWPIRSRRLRPKRRKPSGRLGMMAGWLVMAAHRPTNRPAQAVREAHSPLFRLSLSLASSLFDGP
jgi:hypothetical protein